MFDEKQYALVWDAVLAFPIKFKDLTLNSRLVSDDPSPVVLRVLTQRRREGRC